MHVYTTVSAQQLPYRPDIHMTAGTDHAGRTLRQLLDTYFESYSPVVAYFQ
jgi:hypothetical protein